MALVDLNQLFETLTGALGNLVFRRRPDGKQIVSSKPRYRGKRNRKGTPAQRAYRQHVKETGPYAKHLSKVHPIYAQLAAEPDAKAKWMSAYNFAFADCMKPPVIHRIERREGCIRVEATDNIGVTQVCVMVLDEAGKPLEAGDAIRAEGDWWEYAPRVEASGKRIAAKAFDLPGNCTRREI
jgi:hypothetical protein